jgi:uncharacterized DUF497 family protein
LKITFTPAKRDKTLAERGIDFADAAKVFAGRVATREDTRFAYGETRYITAGRLDGRFVILVWTPRDDARHIISMRYGHAKEEENYRDVLG